MPIEFCPETCATIIETTAIERVSMAVAPALAIALNQAADNLLRRFEQAPVTNSKAIRDDIGNMERAIDRLRWRIGFPRYSGDMGSDLPEWAAVVQSFSQRPDGPHPDKVDKQMRQLLGLLLWLRTETKALEEFYNHGAPGNRKAAVNDFCQEMLIAYKALFDRDPGVSRGTGGDQPTGPTFRFLLAVLEQLRKKLAESSLRDAANDPALHLSPYAIEGRIRNYSR